MKFLLCLLFVALIFYSPNVYVNGIRVGTEPSLAEKVHGFYLGSIPINSSINPDSSDYKLYLLLKQKYERDK